MSKASEWARELEDVCREHSRIEREAVPRFFIPDGSGVPAAYADADGTPFFERVKGRWATEHALALAHWILDTFGEDAPKETASGGAPSNGVGETRTR